MRKFESGKLKAGRPSRTSGLRAVGVALLCTLVVALPRNAQACVPAGDPLTASLQIAGDDMYDVYVNGTWLYSCGGGPPKACEKAVTIPIDVTWFNQAPADNVLAMYVTDTGGSRSGVTWQLTLTYSDCPTQTIQSDGFCTRSIYAGNINDGTVVEPPGWRDLSYNDSSWVGVFTDPGSWSVNFGPDYLWGESGFGAIQGDGYLFRQYFQAGNDSYCPLPPVPTPTPIGAPADTPTPGPPGCGAATTLSVVAGTGGTSWDGINNGGITNPGFADTDGGGFASTGAGDRYWWEVTDPSTSGTITQVQICADWSGGQSSNDMEFDFSVDGSTTGLRAPDTNINKGTGWSESCVDVTANVASWTTADITGMRIFLANNQGSGPSGIDIDHVFARVTYADPSCETPTPTPDLPSRTYTRTFTPTPTFTSSFTRTFTPTSSFTRTITSTWTPTYTPSSTFTWTSTSTYTATPTVTFTDTPTVTFSPTFSRSPSPTQTYTRTYTSTWTPTYTMSATSTWSLTWTPTYTDTPTYTWTPTETPPPTFTNTSTFTPTFTTTDTLTASETLTDSPTHTLTYSNSLTYSTTPTSTISPTPTHTFTHTPTRTHTVTYSPRDTHTTTFTITPTETPGDTPTQSETPTPTFTHSETLTYSETLTNTQTWTPTSTNSNTLTHSETLTSTATWTPTFSASNTLTYSTTWTMTSTPTWTPTASATFSHTPTWTPTYSASNTLTATPTWTSTSTWTSTVTPSMTQSVTPTPSATSTWTPTITDTATPSSTWTMTGTPLPTPTVTPTFTQTPYPPPNLDIVVTASKETVYAKKPFELTTRIENLGASLASPVTITLTLPNGMIVVDAGSGVVSGNEIIWVVGTLAPGGVLDRTITVDAQPGTEGTELEILAEVFYGDPILSITNQDDAMVLVFVSQPPFFEVDRNAFSGPPQRIRIKFASALESPATLNVYNSAGELIKRLGFWVVDAGVENRAYWDGTNQDGEIVASGIYLLRLEVRDLSYTRRVAVVR